MTTAIIGVGQLGSALAQQLVRGGERVVVAARDDSHSAALAEELGPLASSASVGQAIGDADTIVFAVWLNMLMEIVVDKNELLKGKVVVDPTNPIKVDANGALVRSLPEGQSSGSVVARLLPLETHYVKAFGSLGAQSLAASTNRSPRAVLFYATDDAEASSTVERLISAAGFDPIKAGGLTDVARLEMPDGDLSQGGGLKGALLDADQARAAVAAPAVA